MIDICSEKLTCTDSFFSKPIYLPGPHNLILKDYDLLKVHGADRDRLLEFNYPKEMVNRKREIEIDKAYIPMVTQSVVCDRERINAGAQLFNKKKESDKLPIQYSFRVSENGKIIEQFDIAKDVGGHCKVTEIGKLKILFENIQRSKIKKTAQLIFWSVWLFIVKNHIDYVYCTADSNRPDLSLFYEKKLQFKEIAKVKYLGSDTTWTVFRRCFTEDRKNRPLYPSIPYVEDFYFNTIEPACSR